MAESAHRRFSPNVAAGLILAAIVVAVLLWQQPWKSDETSRVDVIALPSDPAAVLTAQARALTTAADRAEFVAAFGHDRVAKRVAADVWDAQKLTGIRDVTWRYIKGGDVAVHDNGDAEAQLDVTWDGGETRVATRVRAKADGTFAIVAVSAAGEDPLPVWLAGALTSSTAAGLEVIRVDGGDSSADLDLLTAIARQQVVSVLGGVAKDGLLLVLSAPSQHLAADLLGSPTSALDQIAAVATSRDDREGRLPSRFVVLNPAQFAAMDERAAQVVLTHEATHVLAGGLGSRAETWVVEGFADFVALHDDPESLEVSAGQILDSVARSGAPDDLPTSADFASAAHGLGAVYESAWLAFRMLAEDHGDAAVISFYRDVVAGKDLNAASRRAFGEPISAVTQQWRRYLTKLAAEQY